MPAADALRRRRNPTKDHLGRGTGKVVLTQRMDALKRANEIRTRRARLKRDLKAAGRRSRPPARSAGVPADRKVFDLLLAVPKYGPREGQPGPHPVRISPSKTIGGLSERQRNELVSYLRR